MSPYLEAIIPVAIAIYGGYQQQGNCKIEPAAFPLAENMCQGLRASLEEGCTRLLDLPLGKTGVYLAGRYSIKPVALRPLVKEKVAEGYSACVGFWNGAIDYETYQATLEQKASVLHAMFMAVGKPAEAKSILDIAVANGANRQKAGDEKTAAAVLAGDCASTAGMQCVPVVTPPVVQLPTDASVQSLDRLTAAMKDLTQEMRQSTARNPGVSIPTTWAFAAEIGFPTGSYQAGTDDCAKLIAAVVKASPTAQRIMVMGSADERGTAAGNETLSLQRAASAAQCLASSAPPRNWMIEITGIGVLATPPEQFGRARRATVFVSRER